MPLAAPVVIASAALGALAGAAVPRAAYRWSVPWGEPLRADCASCGATLVGGAMGAFAGRCPRCRQRLGPARWWTVPAGAIAGAAAALGADSGWTLAAGLLLAALGVLLAAIDLAVLRLPDPLVGLAAAGTGLLLAGAAWNAGDGHRLLVALVSGGVALVAFGILSVLSGGTGIGLGDAKLAGVLALLLGWWGWAVALLGLALAIMLNGAVSLVLLVARRVGWRTGLPMGPALLAGAAFMLGLLGLLRG